VPRVFATLLYTFSSLVPILIRGKCTALLLALSFAVVDGIIDNLDNPLCLCKMKLGKSSRIVLSLHYYILCLFAKG